MQSLYDAVRGELTRVVTQPARYTFVNKHYDDKNTYETMKTDLRKTAPGGVGRPVRLAISD